MTDPLTDAQLDAEHAAAVAAVTSLCKCGHLRTDHSEFTGRCWSVVCGCLSMRPKETQPVPAQCENRAPNSDDGYCRCALDSGHEGRHCCPHGDGWAAR